MTLGAAFGEPREIDAGAAADFEHRSAAIAVEVDEPQQVMELFEVILIEIVEEPARADRMPRDLEIVDVPVPSTSRTSSIVATRIHYTIAGDSMPRLHEPRSRSRSTARTFDVLVVGGGIYGLTIAYDAAQRGLSVALVERDDFGSGASFNHLRTIHGGLRYLQTLDLARARESVRERRTLARIAPHAVRPLPFVAAALSIADARASWRCAPASCSIALVASRSQSRRARRRIGCPAGASCSRGEAIAALSRAAPAAA